MVVVDGYVQDPYELDALASAALGCFVITEMYFAFQISYLGFTSLRRKYVVCERYESWKSILLRENPI